jgi:hypothetical protein
VAEPGLDVLIGEWETEIPLPDGVVRGHVSVERLGEFLVYHGTVERAEFPDSVSILDAARGKMHYFDTRGVARVLDLDLTGRVLTLSREDEDWDQRFVGEISDDGNAIDGAWERSEEPGSPLQHDFDMSYRRVG